MTDDQVKEVFRKIASGERKHGSFLTHFAAAVLHADFENFHVVKFAARNLIAKYKLEKYAEVEEAG